ncbi:MAG TPA: hypothetical protein VJT31_40855, partial [Rugosimonospora sp.]|nr:hypothetical protein [Rugosimonospora sp.]
MAAAAGTSHDPVIRELLVRYLDGCAPAVLHSARRMTYAQAYGCGVDPSGVAALRVFAEFADLLRKRRLDLVFVEDDPAHLAGLLAAGAAELDLPDRCRVHTAAGGLVPALTGAGAFGAPILAFLDAAGRPAPDAETLAAIARDRGGEALIVLDPDGASPAAFRDGLHAAGFTLVASVELVDGPGRSRPLFFGTNTERHLDSVKDALWAVDEYAGVRYRDPADPDRALLDISLTPNVGPLRRLLLDQVRRHGPRTVADLRRYARAQTVYRSADATRAVHA